MDTLTSTAGHTFVSAVSAPGETAGQLCDVAAREGLAPDDLRQILGALDDDRRLALDFLLGVAPTARRSAVRSVLERLEDALEVDLGIKTLVSPWARFGRHLADIVGVVVGVGCGWIVVGGLIEGDSLLLGRSAGPAGFILFATILSVLGLFEALHTSATMLKIADLGGLAKSHPRAARLHRRFRSDSGLTRFLAGRQMIVVLTVFFCSPLSSFPRLTHLPLTNLNLPTAIRPLVIVGIPGALFVLWFGQLVPQFLATRRAVALTDTRIVAIAFRIAYLLEAIGLARPGFWMVNWDKSTASIPSSASLRWLQTAREVDGFGVVGFTREWLVRAGHTELSVVSTIRIYRRGPQSITDGSLIVPGAPLRLVLDATATRGERPVPLAPSDYRDEILPTGDHRFHKALISAIGSYNAGDRLRLSLDADYSTDPGRDLVHVERPVRFVCFRVVPDGIPELMRPATLYSYRVGDGLGDLVQLREPVIIEPHYRSGGIPVIEHVVHFPPANTLYILDWDVGLNA